MTKWWEYEEVEIKPKRFTASGPDHDGDFELTVRTGDGSPFEFYLTREQADKLIEVLSRPFVDNEV